MDVAKVDQRMLHMLHILHLLQLQPYVLSVSDVPEVCFIGVFRMQVASVFIWMLHMFHTYVACVLFGCLCMVAMVLKCFSCVFFQVLQKYVSSVSTAFILYVATIVFGCFKSRSGVASPLPNFCYIVSPGDGKASI